MKTDQYEIDGIVYTFRQANFMEAKNQAMKLVSLAKGCFTKEGEETTFDIGQLLSNLGSPETQSVENFIIKYTEAKDERGDSIQLNKPDVFNKHFNEHRDHYFQVIFEGAKYHFLGFIPSGLKSQLNMEGLLAMATA